MSGSHRDNNKSQRDELAVGEPDISVEPDISIVPDESEDASEEIGADLYLLPPEIEVIKEDSESADSDGSGGAGSPRREKGLAEYFGPEVTAGIVIAAMFAIFAILMILDVSGSDPAEGDEPANETTPAEVIEVEIGEGVTLERE